MAWRSLSPDGSKSVKANNAIIQDNTTYIENKMALDHYWDEDSDGDGRHKFVNMPEQSSDVSISTGMDGVTYLKSDGTLTQKFFRNSAAIYQETPGFLSGSVTVTSSSSYSTVVAVPAFACYGDIFMYTTALGKRSAVTGFFRCNGTTVESWALTNHEQGSGSAVAALKFGNGSEASGLNIRARADDASSGLTWNFRITYRAL